MEVILGKRSGFCYGVQNAVDKAERELIHSNKNIYCLGELVHNKVVTKDLEDRGLKFINDIKQAKGKAIIRAHGIAKEVYEEAKKQKIELIDLTCPNVLKIHDIAFEYNKKGYYILLIGKQEHPETIGTISFCGKNSSIISYLDEVEETIKKIEETNLKKILVISQTTYSIKMFENIVERLSKEISKDIELKVKNTICSTTEQRQKEAEKISKQVQLMIVIGGRNSSNTIKLYDICIKNCENVIYVEDERELDLKNVLKYQKVGVVAGASTPRSSIEKIINLLKNKEEK